MELACFGDGDIPGNSNGPRMCLGGGGSKCHQSKFVCVVDLPDREYNTSFDHIQDNFARLLFFLSFVSPVDWSEKETTLQVVQHMDA